MQKENKVIVKLNCFPGPCRTGENRGSRFFVSDGKTSVRSKIGRCRFFRRPQDRQNTDFNVGLTPDLSRPSSPRNVSMRGIGAEYQSAPLYPAFARPARTGMTNGASGFTLIELLVVVLIIGILAAVALPQYQKAVEKSRAAQALTMLKTVYDAAKAYQLSSGNWPENFDELAVEIPWTGTTDGVSYGHHRHGKSNPDWSIQILNSSTEGKAITVGRISGPYTGASFYIYDVPHYSQFAQDELVCIERRGTGNGVFHFTKSRGDYCKKIMKGTFVQTQSSGNWDAFKMP